MKRVKWGQKDNGKNNALKGNDINMQINKTVAFKNLEWFPNCFIGDIVWLVQMLDNNEEELTQLTNNKIVKDINEFLWYWNFISCLDII